MSAIRHVSESVRRRAPASPRQPNRAPLGLPERFSHESDSEGHGQILLRVSSADGRQCGARPEGLDQPDPHRMTLPHIRSPPWSQRPR